MPTVAEQLRAAREAHHYTIQQVAEVTKMKSDHVRALEEGNYDVFVAPVFIRGFARAYANMLRLDTALLMHQLDAELGKTQKFREPPPLTDEPRGILDFLMLQLSKINWTIVLPILVVAFLLLMGSFAVRIWHHYQSRDPLAELGPGRYEAPSTYVNEYLPIPTNGIPTP